jgi:hypothetical protein
MLTKLQYAVHPSFARPTDSLGNEGLQSHKTRLERIKAVYPVLIREVEVALASFPYCPILVY